MFPIHLRRQMETLLQTYCFEIQVTCAQPTEQDKSVQRMALHLVQYLAVFLAEIFTSLLQRVLTHPAGRLVDDTNAALLTQKFWVQAITQSCCVLLAGTKRLGNMKSKDRQICDGNFSPAILNCQMCDSTFSPAHWACKGCLSPF